MTSRCCPCRWLISSGHFWALGAARRFKSYVSLLLICSLNGYTYTGFHTCMHRCQLEVCKGKRNHIKSGCWSSSQGLGVCDLRTLVPHGRPDVSDLPKPCPCGLAFGSPAPCVALSTMGWGAGLRPFACGGGVNISLTHSSPCLQGSGGTAGVPGERGRTGPLGRKVCLDKRRAHFLRSSPSQNLSLCPPALRTPSFPCRRHRLDQWDPCPVPH